MCAQRFKSHEVCNIFVLNAFVTPSRVHLTLCLLHQGHLELCNGMFEQNHGRSTIFQSIYETKQPHIPFQVVSSIESGMRKSIGSEVLRFLRPGVLQQLHASNVTDACHQLVQWNMIRMKVEKHRTMGRKGRCHVAKVTNMF